MATTRRPAREHRTTAQEAGLSRVSIVSVLAGTLTAYGTFAVVAAIVGSLLAAADVDTEFRTDDWASSGFVAGLASALVLFLAYLFGGYVAGRMARRLGMVHGIAVVVLSLVIAAVVGGGASLSDDSAVQDSLRSIGIPTSWDQVEGVAVFGAIASLIALVLGGILGGILGERWHTRLARRVSDPDRGPAADGRGPADGRSPADPVLHREPASLGRDDDRSTRRHRDEPSVVDVRDAPARSDTEAPTWPPAPDRAPR